MKKTLVYVTLAITLPCFLTACGQKGDATNASAKETTAPTADTTKKFTLGMVANKYDPSCGMPLTAGLEDTTHYNGKAYGFCSKECKNEFLKNPAGYLAKIK